MAELQSELSDLDQARLDALRQRAAAAIFSKSADTKLAGIYAEIERKYGAEEAALLRGQIDEVRSRMPKWLPFAMRWNRQMRGWRAFVLAVVVFLVVFVICVLANGGS